MSNETNCPVDFLYHAVMITPDLTSPMNKL